MEENCTYCKSIDFNKKKEKIDSAGKKEVFYWCKTKKKYVQIGLYACNDFKLNKDMANSSQSGKNNGFQRTHKK